MLRFQRSQVVTLGERFAEAPLRLISLFGPRQTGKTTIVQQALGRLPRNRSYYRAVDHPPSTGDRIAPAATTATLTAPRERDADWLVHHWEEARRQAERYGKFVIVFDEIQKIPQWSETVKGLWDADRASGCPLHVVILGIGSTAHAVGVEREPRRSFRTCPGDALVVSGNGCCFRLQSAAVSVLRRVPGSRSIPPGRGSVALLRHQLDHRTEYRAGYSRPDPRGQASAATQPLRPGCGLFRPDSILQQDVGSASGCWQHNHPRPLPCTCCQLPVSSPVFKNTRTNRIASGPQAPNSAF